GKAETFKTRRHSRQRFDLDRSRRNRGGCDKFAHGVAFLSWNQHPEPTSSRRATPLLLFQYSPGHRATGNATGAVVSKGFGFWDVLLKSKINLFGNDGGSAALAVIPYVKIPSGTLNISN